MMNLLIKNSITFLNIGIRIPSFFLNQANSIAWTKLYPQLKSIGRKSLVIYELPRKTLRSMLIVIYIKEYMPIFTFRTTLRKYDNKYNFIGTPSAWSPPPLPTDGSNVNLILYFSHFDVQLPSRSALASNAPVHLIT